MKLIFLGSQFSVIHFVPCTVHFSAVSNDKEDDLLFVPQYLSKNGITDVTLDNFSFSTKLHIGEFLECKEVCDFNLNTKSITSVSN